MKKLKFINIIIVMITILFSEEKTWATTTFDYYWNLTFNQIRFREPVNFTPFETKIGYMTYGGSDYWNDLISTDLGKISPVILDSTNNSFNYLNSPETRTLAFIEFDFILSISIVQFVLFNIYSFLTSWFEIDTELLYIFCNFLSARYVRK